ILFGVLGQRLQDTLRKIAAGRPLAEADPGLDPSTRYHVLALGPSAARLVVRWYLVGTLGDLARRIGEHWQDMRLEPLPWRTPPSVQWLALQTVPARKNKSGGYVGARFVGEIKMCLDHIGDIS